MIYFLFFCSLVDLVSDYLDLFGLVSLTELKKKDNLKIIDFLHISHIDMLIKIKHFNVYNAKYVIYNNIYDIFSFLIVEYLFIKCLYVKLPRCYT